MMTSVDAVTEDPLLVRGRIQPSAEFLTHRRLADRLARVLLAAAAAVSVLVTTGIVYVLISESAGFFAHVPLKEFLTDTEWTPVFENARYGMLPLLAGTVTIAGIALLIAVPAGLALAVYLSEYAHVTVRETIKPLLELIEGVPTVVYGYFALLFVTPLLQRIIPGLPGFNMLSPGVVMGIAILPYTASLSEDAMRAVPKALREGGYALGFSRFRVATRVVIPAALSGISAAFVLGMSRAVGETMVVAIAAGQNANFTFNPLEGAATITAYIVQISMGDLPYGSIAYQSVFAVGLVLFIMTFLFNVAGFYLRRRFREVY